MSEFPANPTIDAATVASHLTEIRRQHQEPRKQPNPKTTFTARQEKAFKIAQKRSELQVDLEAEWATQVERANALAEKHGIKPSEMQRRVQRTSTFTGQTRGANAWNAYVHFKATEINQGL